MADATISRFTYRAFISYSHRDKAWADWLHRALETWRVPPRLVGTKTAHGIIPRRLNPIFRDRDELASADSLADKVNAALEQSENLIVICSPASATSRWVNEEVLAWKRLGRAGRVFCLIVAGEPDATKRVGSTAEECFCPALRFVIDTDGQPTSEKTELIAADARPGQDGKPNAKLKLIAGMLGVGFDALKQREQHRKMRRMTTITALALVAMLLTSALALAALMSRHAAMLAQQAAERRQKQAEDLVGFMLGDLNEKLDQMQRLDLVQRVNDKALAYFAAMPPTDVSDTTLVQRAKALEQVGIVRMGNSNLAGALEAFHASARLSAPLATQAPDDPERQVAYSRTLAFIGLVHWNQDKLAEAQRDFEASRPALQRLAAARGAASARFQLLMLDNNLGHVHEALGQPDAAASFYRERLSLARQLVTEAPDKQDYAAALGGAHNDLGRLALQQGDLLAAIGEYRASDAIQTRLWEDDRNDNLQRQAMLEARAILGRTLALAGADAEGMRRLAEAIDAARQLARLEAGNADFRVDLALYSAQLARLKRLAGDVAASRTLVASASTLFDALIREDPDNAEWQKYAAVAWLEQAELAQAAGNAASARDAAGRASQRLHATMRQRPGDGDTLQLAASAALQLAGLEHDAASARAHATAALQVLDAAPASRHDLRLLALRVEALVRLDRHADAQALAARLQAAGYRDAALLDVLVRAHIDYPPNPDFQARLLALEQPDAAVIPP